MISNKRKTTQKAFTLIEVLVSMSIIVIISSIAIGYSGDIRRNLTLLRTQSQLIAMVNHAKSLTLNFQLDPPEDFRICSYGFHVDRGNNEFIVFRDLIEDDEDCEDEANHAYDPSSDPNVVSPERLSGRLNNFSLDTSVLKIIDTPGEEILEDVVFIPPIPEVIIKDNQGFEVEPSASFGIEIEGTTTRFHLTVDNSGQVTIE